ncbi:hypothetical protein AT4G14650 [Arabidopsis thaliana]|uniref:At4g14650 n=1 Tax=Arabidopsis thaliana TaxID=3702 RepID=Q6NKT4_ARATH|nr:uncharacterized protein AT4G14650 [Arabidopsis thaliana]AAT06428.1 At4g14650 [Arabidopsis thaliana]AAW80867.1 At4g14650 [Arabidopsis thaliana]AEE83471.1 hypothetical protein AT4G14650 [Arabidopsis thaliana]|eukprot:NP_193201.2 hypothetical protein AT4G14650 [Arabidopsis thaliana]
MGNNNATAILSDQEESSKLKNNGIPPLASSVDTTQDLVFIACESKDGDEEIESSKLETNGMSPLDSVSLETAQDQVFLEGEEKDGDEEKESSNLETNGMSPLESVPVEITQEQVFLEGEEKDGDQEKESLKLEINGMSPLDSILVETRQDQLFLAGEEKEGDLEKESSTLETNGMSPFDSIPIETTEDQFFLAGEGNDGDEEKESLCDGVEETEPHSKDLVDEPKVKHFEEEMDHSGLESLVMETSEKLQKQTSVAKGVENLSEAREVEVLSMNGTQTVVSKLNSTVSGNEERLCVIDEIVNGTQTVVSKLNSTVSGNEERLCVIDEIVFESPRCFATVDTDENMVNESRDEIVHSEEVVKLDQETGIEQRRGREEFPEIEPQEILNLDYRIVHDEEVTDKGKADKAISNSKPCSQESNANQDTGLGVYKEEKEKREASLRRMYRCRSLPVSQNSRVIGDSLVQHLVSEVAFPSRNKMGLEKANTSAALLVPCVGSNKTQETIEAIIESSKEARFEMPAPSFDHGLRIEERRDESVENTPVLCEDKTEIYEATIDVEEKTVMLKRSESVKSRGSEMSLGSLKKHNDSFKETKGSEDNLVDKKASPDSMKGIVRKRSKSSLLGTCLCCTTAMN